MPAWEIIQWVALVVLILFAGAFIVTHLSKGKVTQRSKVIFAAGILASMGLAILSAVLSP